MRWTMNEYNHDARTQSPRLTEARLQLAVGRFGLGPREQGDQRTQRVFRAYVSCENTHRAAAAPVLGSDALFKKKYHVKRLGTSLRDQTRARA